MDQRVSLITLGVANLGRSLRFYEALGWKRGNADAGVVFFQLPGFILALWSRCGAGGGRAARPTTVASAASRLPTMRARATRWTAFWPRRRQAGARLLKAAHDTFWGGYSGYFADPDGHPWEVAFNPGWSIDREGRVSLKPPA